MALSDKIEIVKSIDAAENKTPIGDDEFIKLAEKVRKIIAEEAKHARDIEEARHIFAHPSQTPTD